MHVRKFFGSLAKIFVVSFVLAFMGLHSFNFFQFIFDEEHWFYAILGFGLTSGAVVAYLVVLISNTEKNENGKKTSKLTDIEAFVTISLIGVSLVGEVATAMFGMQIEAWAKSGIEFAQSDIQMMIYAVSALGFFHGIGLVVFMAGDIIKDILSRDENGDGVPDVFQPVTRKPASARSLAADTSVVELADPKA